jgi:hypothetical protein
VDVKVCLKEVHELVLNKVNTIKNGLIWNNNSRRTEQHNV